MTKMWPCWESVVALLERSPSAVVHRRVPPESQGRLSSHSTPQLAAPPSTYRRVVGKGVFGQPQLSAQPVPLAQLVLEVLRLEMLISPSTTPRSRIVLYDEVHNERYEIPQGILIYMAHVNHVNQIMNKCVTYQALIEAHSLSSSV